MILEHTVILATGSGMSTRQNPSVNALIFFLYKQNWYLVAMHSIHNIVSTHVIQVLAFIGASARNHSFRCQVDPVVNMQLSMTDMQ